MPRPAMYAGASVSRAVKMRSATSQPDESPPPATKQSTATEQAHAYARMGKIIAEVLEEALTPRDLPGRKAAAVGYNWLTMAQSDATRSGVVSDGKDSIYARHNRRV